MSCKLWLFPQLKALCIASVLLKKLETKQVKKRRLTQCNLKIVYSHCLVQKARSETDYEIKGFTM